MSSDAWGSEVGIWESWAAYPSTQARRPVDGATEAPEGLVGAYERYRAAQTGVAEGQVLRTVLDNVLAEYRDMSPEAAHDLARQLPFSRGTITEQELECIAAAALTVLVSLQRRCHTQ